MSETADTAVAASAEAAPTTDAAAPASAPETVSATAETATSVETPAELSIDDELSAIYRKANPDREPNGKFAAKEKPAEPEVKPVEVPAMPASWAKDRDEIWQELTPRAREQILKREADSAAGVEKLKATYEPYKALEAAIKPHEGLLAQMGKTPVQGVLGLIEAHQKLSGPDKYRHLLEIAQNYGIDVARMFAPQGQRPGQNSYIDQLANEVHQLKAARAAEIQARTQAVEADLTKQIETFSKKPEREHFEVLKPEMAKLLISGVADGLDDAYDKAALLNPDIRSQIEAKAKSAAEEKVRAEQAKKVAAINVKGNAASAASPKPLDDQLREIYRRSRAS